MQVEFTRPDGTTQEIFHSDYVGYRNTMFKYGSISTGFTATRWTTQWWLFQNARHTREKGFRSMVLTEAPTFRVWKTHDIKYSEPRSVVRGNAMYLAMFFLPTWPTAH